MHISIKWFQDQFNVQLHSREGADEFLSIKGCRIVNGSKGEFISWPATKNPKTDKWWRHVWANEKFEAEVLRLARESRQREPGSDDEPNDDLPDF